MNIQTTQDPLLQELLNKSHKISPKGVNELRPVFYKGRTYWKLQPILEADREANRQKIWREVLIYGSITALITIALMYFIAYSIIPSPESLYPPS